MNSCIFGPHRGHYPKRRADAIARRHGARYISIKEPDGTRLGWFVAPSMGATRDAKRARRVAAALRAAGLQPR